MWGRQRVGLAVLCTASFIAVADTTIVSIALPSMRQALGFSTSGLQWVLNAYALTFGGLLLLSGRVADLYGRRRLFIFGLAVFAVGSLVGGLAWQPGVLIAGRFLQGLGASAFIPASLSLLTGMFVDDSDRNRAIGLYGAMAALGFVVGMVGGGVITEFWGWQGVLFVNVPVAMAALVLGVPTLPETRNRQGPGSVDILGALTVTSGLVAVIYAMSLAPELGWTSLRTVVTGVAGLGLLVLFCVIEWRHHSPLVPIGVVARRPVLLPNVAITLQSMIGIAWLYVLTLYFQEVLHHGPLQTGLLFAPMTLAAVIGAPVGGRLATRLGLRTTAASGLTLMGVGLVAMMTGMAPSGSLALVIGGMVVGEVGFMLSNVSLTAAGTRGLPDRHEALAAGLLNTFIQLGNGCGLGIVAVVVASTLTTPSPDPSTYISALRWGLFACVCFCAPALLLAVFGLGQRAEHRRDRVYVTG